MMTAISAPNLSDQSRFDESLATTMPALIERLAPLHARLCPRQVLGARIGLHGAGLLGLEAPRLDKRLLVIVETDGCFVDGVIVATGCRVGRRTLRVVDHGKVAAVFVDTLTGQAVRVRPRRGARAAASRYAPDAPDAWHAQLDAYHWMPTAELLESAPVELLASLDAILGRAGVRVECDRCGEEILNDRQVQTLGQTLCRGCADDAYVRRVI